VSKKKLSKTKLVERSHSAAGAILLLYVVCLGFAASLALSSKLWLSERVFPHAPLFSWLGPWPQGLQILLFAGMFVCLVLLMWRPFMRGAVIGIVSIWAIMVMQDQMRLQPWAYQYVLMLLPFAWIGRKGENAAGVIWIAQVIMVAVYFWGGLHKLGPQFVGLYEDTLMVSWLENSSGFVHSFLKAGSTVIPWTEMLMAVLLVFPKTRRIGVVMAWVMHLIILVWLGPVGIGINSVIWPWNMAMMVLVSVLFWMDSPPLLSLEPLKESPRGMVWIAALVGVLAAVAPIFSMTGKWDRYLGFHLYSGHQQRVILALQPSGVAKLDDSYAPFVIEKRFFGNMSELDFMPWAHQELNAPFVSEDRVALALAKSLVERLGLSNEDGFFYRDFPLLTDQFHMEKISPSQIKAMEKMERLQRIR